ncbi:hypothetical protein BJV74DRAFT_197405 [Russula compacta]|nr:hypothetical protein BJV74DRAFT_197405 [Russula compacta]
MPLAVSWGDVGMKIGHDLFLANFGILGALVRLGTTWHDLGVLACSSWCYVAQWLILKMSTRDTLSSE